MNAKGGILGRQVQIKIVDDASSPTQVVTNYQNLINTDKVDLVFGPFSSLLTIPASQVAKRYGYAFIEPAGGGPDVFAQNLDNLFFVQPAPGRQVRRRVRRLGALAAGAPTPKTAAYAELDDPFAAPIAENIRARFEAAGIKTVYKQVYPAETQDFSPIMAKVAAAKPDVLVSGTQSEDAYAQVKSLIQLKFSPKFMFMSNGANSPVRVPGQGRRRTTPTASCPPARLVPGLDGYGSDEFTAAYIAKYGGDAEHDRQQQRRGVRRGPAARGGRGEDRQGRQRDDHQHAAPAEPGRRCVGDLSWAANGAPSGSFNLIQWQGGKLAPGATRPSVAQAQPVYPKPNWGG